MKTIAFLIEYLKQLPPDAVVVLSKDPEGNGFSPWSGTHDSGKYNNEYWEFYSDSEEETKNRKGKKAIVLWP